MILRVCLLFSLLGIVHSLSLSKSYKDIQRQIFGTVSVAIATSLPISAHAVEVIKIDADIPGLIQIAKDNKDVAIKLAQQTATSVKISGYPKSYANILNFVRDIAAGDVFLQVNGVPIDVSVLSEKGAIDIDVATEVGDVSVTLTSEYLPKLPFLSKRVVTLPVAAADGLSDAAKVDSTSTKAIRTQAAAAIKKESEAKVSFFDLPLDPFQKGWTVKQVLGTTSLGLGIAYASSYAYYIKSIEDEERATAEKKKLATQKAAAQKSKSKTVEKNVLTETVELNKDDSMPVTEMKIEDGTSSSVNSKPEKQPVTEVSKDSPSGGGWRFWKK